MWDADVSRGKVWWVFLSYTLTSYLSVHWLVSGYEPQHRNYDQATCDQPLRSPRVTCSKYIKDFETVEKYKDNMQENTFICACNSYRKGYREYFRFAFGLALDFQSEVFGFFSWEFLAKPSRGSFLFINYDSPPSNALRCINELFQAR